MPQLISCSSYASFLATQTPTYDALITRDIRPFEAQMMGYFKSAPFNAYTGYSHTFQRFHSVYPDTTRPWEALGTGADCEANLCDPPENEISWGWSQETYGLERISYKTPPICFDQAMARTEAKEHFRHIIEKILRPASITNVSAWVLRRAAELAGNKVCVSPGLPAFTFTWDAGGYIFMTSTCTPTGRLTAPILQDGSWDQYMVGGSTASEDGFSPLHLKTDKDTLRYLTREDPTLLDAWRFQKFTGANPEFYKYGFNAAVGDYMATVLLFPMRFNRITDTRYQQVLPFTNEAATTGIKQEPNDDYKRAQYQFSMVTNPGAIIVKPFKAESLNPNMPFMVRDYGGKWNFAMDNLGSDRSGRAIANYRRNKGFFWADFQLAAKAEHPEWLTLYFHKTDRPCITMIDTCNTAPGYPDQSYNMTNPACPCDAEFVFTATANQAGTYAIAANSILVNGVAITHAAVGPADFATMAADLDTAWTNATQEGTWAVEDADDKTIKITYTAAENQASSISIPWLIT